MNKIEAGIFDIGGVLVSGKWYEHAVSDIAQNRDITEDEVKKAWGEITSKLATGKITEKEHWEMYPHGPKALPLPEQSLFITSYRKYYKPHIETLNIVEELHDKNLKLGVLSNTLQMHVDYLRQRGIFEFFDQLIFSCDPQVGVEKPDPRIWEVALERLKVEPKQAFYVDDTEKLLEPPARMGIEVILFKSPSQLRKELVKLKVLK